MFPKTFYGGKFGTLTVATEAQEVAARMAGFEEKQPHQEYPRIMYHASQGTKIVNSDEDKAALGEGWQHQPIADFDPAATRSAEPTEASPAASEPINE